MTTIVPSSPPNDRSNKKNTPIPKDSNNNIIIDITNSHRNITPYEHTYIPISTNNQFQHFFYY